LCLIKSTFKKIVTKMFLWAFWALLSDVSCSWDRRKTSSSSTLLRLTNFSILPRASFSSRVTALSSASVLEKNQFKLRYSDILKNISFGNLTGLDHLNTRIVWYSDVHCTRQQIKLESHHDKLVDLITRLPHFLESSEANIINYGLFPVIIKFC
jgi:hypothetical protein